MHLAARVHTREVDRPSHESAIPTNLFELKTTQPQDPRPTTSTRVDTTTSPQKTISRSRKTAIVVADRSGKHNRSDAIFSRPAQPAKTKLLTRLELVTSSLPRMRSTN
jgi:hypothetical protein